MSKNQKREHGHERSENVGKGYENNKMEKALFINGIFETVLDEIIKSQKGNPDRIFYLQPYSAHNIKQLKNKPPNSDSPMSLYISTTKQLNHICYTADIVGWEDKRKITQDRLYSLNRHITEFQPKEEEIYLTYHEKICVNLISIVNLIKLTNQLSIEDLIKESNGTHLKKRSRSGGWSYVYALPLLSFEKNVAKSLTDSDEKRNNRLANAHKIPEKIQVISTDFRRNPDVVAAVIKRANGICELCNEAAPFLRANGSPYLEVHHWISLSRGGEDTLANAGALCPNCHKRAHFGQDKDFIESNKTFAGQG